MSRQPTEPALDTGRYSDAKRSRRPGDTVVEVTFGKRIPPPRAMSDHGWYHDAAVADARADPATPRR